MGKNSHAVMSSSLAKALMEAGVAHFDVGGPVLPVLPAVGAVGSPQQTKQGGLGGALTAQNGYQAALAPTLDTDYRPLMNTAAGNALAGYGQTQDVMGQQQQLANALLAQSQGQGPNPAQAMLANQTGNNIQQQAALMASQRGAGGNVGLMARQAAMQGGAAQQQAAGQAAAMQAQQQLSAQQQLASQQQAMQQANLGQQQASAGLFGTGAGAQNQQNATTVQNYQQQQAINSGIASANAEKSNGLLGGLLGGLGSAVTSLIPGASTIKGLLGGGGGGAAPAAGGGGPNLGLNYGKMFGLAGGGEVPEHLRGVADIFHMSDYRGGGDVGGHAQVQGDSEKNDTVPAMLSPGEVVLPRSITQHKNAPEMAAEFMRKHQADNAAESEDDDGGIESRIARIEQHLFQGGQAQHLAAGGPALKLLSNLGGSAPEEPYVDPNKSVMDPERSTAGKIGEVIGDAAGSFGRKTVRAFDNSAAAAGQFLGPVARNIGDFASGIMGAPAEAGALSMQGQEPNIGPNVIQNSPEMAGGAPATGPKGQQPQTMGPQQAPGMNPFAQKQADVGAHLQDAMNDLERLTKQESGFSKEASRVVGNMSSAIQGMKTPEQIMQGFKAQDDMFQKAIMENKIDPNRLMSNAGTPGKIAAVIGLALGGMGAPAYGGKNPAMEALDKVIDRDIDAQKNEQGKTMSLWKMNREAFQNDMQANLATRAQYQSIALAQLQKMQVQMAGTEAERKSIPMMLELKNSLAGTRQKQMMLMQAGRGELLNMDPSHLLGEIKNEKVQAEAAKEIEQNMKINNTLQHMDKVMTRLREVSQPGYIIKNPREFKAEMDSLKMNAAHYMRDVAGSSSDTELKAAYSALDTTFTNDKAYLSKMENAHGLFASKRSPGVNFKVGTGMDINSFAATRVNPTAAKLSPQQQEYVKWAKMNSNTPDGQLILKKYGGGM